MLWLIIVQFVLLMDQQDMKAEWRCILMVNGVLCVMITGTSAVRKLSAKNWVSVEEVLLSILESMGRAVVLYG